MGAKNSEHTSATFWKMSAKTSDGAVPGFYKGIKQVDGKYEFKSTMFNEMFGRVVSIEHSTYEHNSEIKHQFKLKMLDNEGAVDLIQFGFNSASYSLLNTLAGSDISKEITMNIWSKDVGSQTYAQIGVKVGGEKGTWAYKPEELPKAETAEVFGKTVKNEEPVINFWVNVIENVIKPKLAGVAPSAAEVDLGGNDLQPDPEKGIEPDIDDDPLLF